MPTRALPRLDLAFVPAAATELRGIVENLDVAVHGAAGGLTPGDTCPDNEPILLRQTRGPKHATNGGSGLSCVDPGNVSRGSPGVEFSGS